MDARKNQPGVVYTSPNKSHHIRYAEGLHRRGLLRRFVAGYPGDLGDSLPSEKVKRVRLAQTALVAACRFGLSGAVTNRLDYLSKLRLDAASGKALHDGDIFLCYNGTGCDTLTRHKGIRVVECVNTHLLTQLEILDTELEALGLDPPPRCKRMDDRRLREYELADYLLVPSRFVARSFTSRGTSEDRLLINPFGMPAPPTVASDVERREGTVLYVGSINYRKGLRHLVEAVRDLPVRLRLVGPTMPPTGFEKISLPENVELVGPLHGDALQREYAGADIFAQPSLEEGLSLVVGEAISHGLPIVATTATGAEEIFVDGECGRIVAPGDTAALREAIEQLLDDRAFHARCHETCLKRAAELKGWEHSQDRLCDLLERL